MRTSRPILALLLLACPAFAAVTKGTASGHAQNSAQTTNQIASFSSSANALLVCVNAFDDNGTSTHITGIVVSGSPTYTTAWAQVQLQFSSGNMGTEVWSAVASSAISAQTVTATISSSERSSFACQSYTGIDTSTPIPASNKAAAATVNVTSSSNDNSLYAGFYGCGTNSGVDVAAVTAGSGYTIDVQVNNDNTGSEWTHAMLETKNAAVSPAATTTVNFSVPGACSGGITQIVGIEIKVAGGGSPAAPKGLTTTGVR